MHVTSNTEPVIVVEDDHTRDRLLQIGPDDRGLDLDVVAITERDYLLVIHVMPHQSRRRTP